MENRRDAAMLEYLKNQVVIFKDQKGIWKSGYIMRKTFGTSSSAFEIRITFFPNLVRLPAANPYGYDSLIFMRENDDIGTLKKRIKSYIGYTPDKETIYFVWNRFQHFKAAYAEEDAFYSGQDKTMAQLHLQELTKLVIARFEAGEEIEDNSRWKTSKPIMERYLSNKEIESATEAQKVLNGNSYVEPLNQSGKVGHLFSFNKSIDDQCTQLNHMKEQEDKRLREQWHQELLETNVAFRRLVALVLHAKKDIRAYTLDKAVAQAIFGYCRSLNEYRDRVYPHYQDLMKVFRLDTYDANKLWSLGNDYVNEGGMLPVPIETEHTREEGQIYYGDYVHDGLVGYEVETVALKYVYTRNGKLLKRSVRHFEYIPLIENPLTVDDYLQNERINLNNYRSIPNAHERSMNEIIQILWSKRVKYKRRECIYKKRASEETNLLKKEALQYFMYGLRALDLRDQMDTLKSLHTLTNQESYNRAQQELESIEKRIPLLI